MSWLYWYRLASFIWQLGISAIQELIIDRATSVPFVYPHQCNSCLGAASSVKDLSCLSIRTKLVERDEGYVNMLGISYSFTMMLLFQGLLKSGSHAIMAHVEISFPAVFAKCFLTFFFSSLTLS